MSGEMTARDRVWTAVVLEHNTRLDVSDVEQGIRRQFDDADVPNDETIRRVLRSMSSAGVLDHSSGSPYWYKSEIRNRWPINNGY